MDTGNLKRVSEYEWTVGPVGAMRAPAVIFSSEALLRDMDDKVLEQLENVASLPGIVGAAFAMPDAHWGYGFPIGGVAAFDADRGGVVSAGGVGFDVSCGVRTMHTGLKLPDLEPVKMRLADALVAEIPAGMGSKGEIALSPAQMDAMLEGGAQWAVEQGMGDPDDLELIEENGRMRDARPDCVSDKAKNRQRREMGTLGSGNHYLEVQRVAEIHDEAIARRFGIAIDDVVVTIHCGSRGLGHQIGTEFLREMLLTAEGHGIVLPDRELACAPIDSEVGRRYLGAMRAAINCALANREIIAHLARKVFADALPAANLTMLYDVSHNTCKVEMHEIDGVPRRLYVHRKGATRAFGPGHPDLCAALKDTGQPVLIGGSMGTCSYVLVGTRESQKHAWGSSCHGAGRNISRRQALKRYSGRQIQDELAARGILVHSPSTRGIAEEAPGAYKDVTAVVEAAEAAGLSRRVAKLLPVICIKG